MTHVRIMLGEAASRALADAGECFLIVGRGSHPDAPGRMVLHCLPVPKAQADAACRVAMGEARATKIKSKADGPNNVSNADNGKALSPLQNHENKGRFQPRQVQAGRASVMLSGMSEGDQSATCQ